MKKLMCLLLCLLMVFSLSACVGEDTPSKETGQNAAADTNKDELFHLNESAVFKDLKFTATEIKESNGPTFLCRMPAMCLWV